MGHFSRCGVIHRQAKTTITNSYFLTNDTRSLALHDDDLIRLACRGAVPSRLLPAWAVLAACDFFLFFASLFCSTLTYPRANERTKQVVMQEHMLIGQLYQQGLVTDK